MPSDLTAAVESLEAGRATYATGDIRDAPTPHATTTRRDHA